MRHKRHKGTWKSWIVLATLLLTVIWTTVGASAEAAVEKPMQGQDRSEKTAWNTVPPAVRMFRTIAGKLGLTSEQSKKLAQVFREFTSQTAELREQIEAKAKEVAKLLASEDCSPELLVARTKELEQLYERQGTLLRGFLEQAKSVLTIEQRAEMLLLRTKMQARTCQALRAKTERQRRMQLPPAPGDRPEIKDQIILQLLKLLVLEKQTDQ